MTIWEIVKNLDIDLLFYDLSIEQHYRISSQKFPELKLQILPNFLLRLHSTVIR